MRTLIAGAIAVLGLFLASPVAGQWSSVLEPGAKIRVIDEDGRRSTGIVQAVTPDSLVFRREGLLVGRERFAFEHIESLEVRVGEHRRVLRTTLITSSVIAGTFGIIGAIAYEECVPRQLFDCLFEPDSRADAAAFGLAVGAIVGVPIGLIHGVLKKHDTWERLDAGRPDGLSASLFAAGSEPGIALGLSIQIRH